MIDWVQPRYSFKNRREEIIKKKNEDNNVSQAIRKLWIGTDREKNGAEKREAELIGKLKGNRKKGGEGRENKYSKKDMKIRT